MRSARSLLTLAIVIVVAILMHGVGFLQPVERGVVGALHPVQATFSRWFPITASIVQQDQRARIAELEQEVVRLQVAQVQSDEAVRLCQETNAQATALGQHALRGVGAMVVGRSPEGDTQVLLIDQGNEKGISNGQPVIADSGVLIGTVVDAEVGRSSILLLNNTQSAIGAEVHNEAHSPGIVSGERGLALRLRSVPQNESIQPGELVVTSALNEKVPANLLIGDITEVHFVTGDLFQEASIRPPLDYQRVRYVTVITT